MQTGVSTLHPTSDTAPMIMFASRLRALGGSDVWLPEGGRLTLYSPAATHNLTRCAHSCFSVCGRRRAGGCSDHARARRWAVGPHRLETSAFS